MGGRVPLGLAQVVAPADHARRPASSTTAPTGTSPVAAPRRPASSAGPIHASYRGSTAGPRVAGRHALSFAACASTSPTTRSSPTSSPPCATSSTDSPTFRRLADELVTLLAYEATRDVRVEPFDIETPVAPTTGIRLASPKPLVVPILRAGLGMLDGMVRLLPDRRGRLPRHDAQRGDARGDDLRQPAARRPVRPPVLRARPDARHRRHARRWRSATCSTAAPTTSPRSACWRRPRASPSSRTRARRPRRAGHRGHRRRRRAAQRAAATSSPASATPATGCTASSEPSGRPRAARLAGRRAEFGTMTLSCGPVRGSLTRRPEETPMRRVKKILLWVLLAFVVYAVIKSPNQAADIVHTAWNSILQAFRASAPSSTPCSTAGSRRAWRQRRDRPRTGCYALPARRGARRHRGAPALGRIAQPVATALAGLVARAVGRRRHPASTVPAGRVIWWLWLSGWLAGRSGCCWSGGTTGSSPPTSGCCSPTAC